MQSAIDLLTEALFLRHNGEDAPGGDENWRDWELATEAYLRGRDEALSENTSRHSRG